MSEYGIVKQQAHDVPYGDRYYTYSLEGGPLYMLYDEVLFHNGVSGSIKPGKKLTIGGYTFRVIERLPAKRCFVCTPSRWTFLHRRTRVVVRNLWEAFSVRVIATLEIWGLKKHKRW